MSEKQPVVVIVGGDLVAFPPQRRFGTTTYHDAPP